MKPTNESFAPRLTPLAAVIIAIVFAIVLVFLDITTGALMNLAIFKSVVLMVTAAARRKPILWAMTAALIVTTYTIMLFDLQAFDDPVRRQAVVINRTFNAITLLLVAGMLHLWINADRESREHEAALQARNKELAARDQEITRQNEALQSQTGKLARQGDELRVANDELAQRERMLETLLALSRSMQVAMGESQALERICETLGQLVNGPGTAAAILVQEPGGLRVRCHYGFGPAGIIDDFIPDDHSFAALILEQRRTGHLEDITLRPELRIPQPGDGPPFAAVLATPLLVKGKPIGTLEVYSRETRTWSDDQVALVESLAAQTSVSLENAQLFRDVEEGRRRLATILESVPVGLAVANAELSEMRFNAAGAALIGVPPDVNIATEFARTLWVIYEDGKQVPRERYPIARACRGERVYPHELELVLPGGRRLTVLSSAAPFHDAAGKISGGVSSFVDITQLKLLQRELETRRREAEEANVRKTRFLAAASHDIRTPANAISLLAELLKRTADSPSMAAEIPQLAEELRQSATSLVTLVSNVLDVTRFDTDKLELHETEFSLARLLEEEARQVLPLAQAKGLILDVEPGDQPVWLRADRIKLGRVLGNLLGNAIKFTDRGGIRLSTARENGEAGAPGDVRVAVTDTGIGVTPQNQAHIFDEFWQLSDPQRSKGSGLGLAISKRLIEAMGGAIQVHSTPGKGSTFMINVPASAVIGRPEPE